MSWQQLADELGTDAALNALGGDQIQAVIDILALVVYADARLGTLERSEFEDQVEALPWLKGKDTEGALAKAKAATDTAGWSAVVDEAAATLSGAGVGAAVYQMAATLAWADLNVHRNESEVLGLIAKGLGVDADKAAQIDADLG